MTVTFSLRHLLLVAAVAAIVAAGTGYAIATLASPDRAGAAAPSAQTTSDARIVRELRQIRDAIGANYKKTSLLGYTSDGFNDLYRATVETCHAIAVERTQCPSFVH